MGAKREGTGGIVGLWMLRIGGSRLDYMDYGLISIDQKEGHR